MSLFLQERIKEQTTDDRATDKNVVFTFPWIIDFPFQVEQDEDLVIANYFTITYKMAATQFLACLKNNCDGIIVSNSMGEVWNGSCFVSYSLYYDSEMRLEFCKFVLILILTQIMFVFI